MKNSLIHLCRAGLFVLALTWGAFTCGAVDVRLAWDANSESDVINYRVYFGTSSRNYTMSNDVGNVTSFTVPNLAAGATYFFAVTAWNNAGLESDFSNEASANLAANQPPSVNAGSDLSITLPVSSVNLSGTATDDGLPAGSTLTPSWSKVSGPGTVTFGNASLLATTATFSQAGNYVLRLTVSDGQASNADDLSVTVSPPPNQPPSVNAGSDQSITLPVNSVNLAGTATDDGLPAGSTLATAWSKVSGPGTVTFGNAALAATVATFSQAGSYVLRLTVSDGQASNADDLSVTVADAVPSNQPPSVNAGNDQLITLPVNTASILGTVLDDGLPPGNTLSTTWSVVSGPGTVSFGNVNLLATSATFSLAGDYVLRLTASDGAATSSDDVNITVVNSSLPVNNPPSITVISDQVVSEDQVFSINFQILDDRTSPDRLTVRASSSNPAIITDTRLTVSHDGPYFSLHLVPQPNVGGSAQITVTVTDADGLTATRSFLLTVLTANDPPTLDPIADLTLPKNSDSQLVILTGISSGAPDEAQFVYLTTRSSNPAVVPAPASFLEPLSFTGALLIEPVRGATGSAIITVTAGDGGPENGFTSRSFTVNVVRTKTSPTLNLLANVVLDEDAPPQTVSLQGIGHEDSADQLPVFISAVSSNPGLVPHPLVNYNHPAAEGFLTFTPISNGSGEAVITVTVDDGSPENGTISRTFTVIINPVADRLVPNDFNHDGHSDLVFQDDQGFLGVWFMNSASLISGALFQPNNVDPNYRIVGTADFNRDGQTDLLFQHADGTIVVWLMSGIQLLQSMLLNPSSPGTFEWRVVATADFNGDGKPDIVLQHTDGSLAVWYLNGINQVSTDFFNPMRPGNSQWRVVGAGDLNGDEHPDLVFQHADGSIATWLLNGLDLVDARVPSNRPSDVRWQIKAITDLNNDGKPDLLFQYEDGSLLANHLLGIWFLDRTSLIQAQLLSPSHAGSTWRLVGPK